MHAPVQVHEHVHEHDHEHVYVQVHVLMSGGEPPKQLNMPRRSTCARARWEARAHAREGRSSQGVRGRAIACERAPKPDELSWRGAGRTTRIEYRLGDRVKGELRNQILNQRQDKSRCACQNLLQKYETCRTGYGNSARAGDGEHTRGRKAGEGKGRSACARACLRACALHAGDAAEVGRAARGGSVGAFNLSMWSTIRMTVTRDKARGERVCKRAGPSERACHANAAKAVRELRESNVSDARWRMRVGKARVNPQKLE